MATWDPKANALFTKALEMHSPKQQTAFLDEACAGDRALRAEVEQLLKVHEEAGNFLQRPLLGDRETQDLAGETGDNPPAQIPRSAVRSRWTSWSPAMCREGWARSGPTR